MTKYEVIKRSAFFSTTSLCKDVEDLLYQKTREGYEVVSVAFGINLLMAPTAFITLKKSY